MDHKVSKDMISSGMIPSGEKTQADLGRTQYGSAPSPNKLMDAYKSMYDKKEEVINEHHKKDADGNTIPHEDEELNEGKIPAGLQAYLDKKKGKKEDKKEVKEMIERIAGGPPRNAMGKVITKSPAKAFGDLLPKDKNKTKSSYSFDKDSLEMKNKLDKRKAEVAKSKDEKKTEVGKIKDERREKVTNIVNKMGESADLFDVISTYFIEEGYDKKDVYAAMSSVDLTEEVQDLHEFIPAIMAGLKAVGGALVKGGAGALAKGGAGALAKGGGAMASKAAGSTIAKGGLGRSFTRAGIKLGGKTGGKIANTIKKNPMTSYMVARDMTSGIQGGGAGQTRTSSISASADLFDIVKGQLIDEGLSEEDIKDIMLTLTPDEILSEYKDVPAGQMNYASYGVPKPKSYEMDSLKRQTAPGGGKDYKIEDKKNVVAYNQKKIAREEYKGSGTPEQQAAMKAQVEISKKVNRYGGKTPSGTTAVDAKKGIEDVRKSM